MLKVKQQPHNSVWVSADSQHELALTFMRFQEFYESPNPNFQNKIFTVGQLRNWYSETYGANTYHNDWTGFNIPSYVLRPFKDGLFDPLTNEEINLLTLFQYRKDSFYIIGAQDPSTLRHELAHALYANNPIYKKAVDNLIQKYSTQLLKSKKYILSKGYCKSVIADELQAYITDNEDEFLIKNINKKIIAEFNRLYQYYSANSKK